MGDEGVEEAVRRSLRAWGIGAGVLVLLVVGGWLGVRAVSEAICSDYNSMSNDFCDDWRYDPPPEDAIPVPPGWEIAWEGLSCGSGGCPTRMYVLVPPPGSDVATVDYVAATRKLGWRESSDPGDLRKDELFIRVEPANDPDIPTVPERLAKGGYVFASIGMCGEAIACR